MMAYLDCSKAETDLIEAQVALKTGNMRLFTRIIGIGELQEIPWRKSMNKKPYARPWNRKQGIS
ncbi:hypothetical protein FOXYSP1_19246 [Fusarium oxysporum f. sp. phaseoli]